MGNVSIKRVVADAIANHLATNIPGLAGKVSSVPAGPDAMAPCLAVKILPESLIFEPAQADEVYAADPDDGKVVCDVGSFTGLFTLQLFTANPTERELYEQRILDLFLATDWAPGTLFINTPNLLVNNYATLYSAELKVRLENEEWNDELAFESRRYGFLEVYIDFPALTTKDAANLQLSLYLQNNTSTPVVTTADIDVDYQVNVLEDGTTTKVIAPTPPPPTNKKILVVFGKAQSNTLGLMDALSMGFTVPNPAVQWVDHNALLSLDGGGHIVYRDEGPKDLDARTIGYGSYSAGMAGIELPLFPDLLAAFPQHTFYGIKCAIDGSGWSSEWNNAGFPSGGPTPLLTQFGAFIAQYIALWGIDTVFLVSLGGEHDSNTSPDFSQVRTALESLSSSVRAAILAAGVTAPVHDIQVRLSHHSGSGGSIPAVCAGVEAWAAANPLNHVVNANAETYRGDGVHYANQSYVNIGHAVGTKIINILNNVTPVNPVCLCNSNIATKSGATALNPVYPLFYKPGDRLMFAYGGIGNTALAINTNDPGGNGDGGFTQLSISPQKDPSSSLNARIELFTYVVPAGKGTESPNTPLNAIVCNDVGGDDAGIGVITNMGPCDIDNTSGDATNTGSSVITTPDHATSGPNRLVAAWVSCKPTSPFSPATALGKVTNWTNANVSQIEEQFDDSTLTGSDQALAMATAVLDTQGQVGSFGASVSQACTQARIVVSFKNR